LCCGMPPRTRYPRCRRSPAPSLTRWCGRSRTPQPLKSATTSCDQSREGDVIAHNTTTADGYGLRTSSGHSSSSTPSESPWAARRARTTSTNCHHRKQWSTQRHCGAQPAEPGWADGMTWRHRSNAPLAPELTTRNRSRHRETHRSRDRDERAPGLCGAFGPWFRRCGCRTSRGWRAHRPCAFRPRS
jgi:hypothetical protein